MNAVIKDCFFTLKDPRIRKTMKKGTKQERLMAGWDDTYRVVPDRVFNALRGRQRQWNSRGRDATGDHPRSPSDQPTTPPAPPLGPTPTTAPPSEYEPMIGRNAPLPE